MRVGGARGEANSIVGDLQHLPSAAKRTTLCEGLLLIDCVEEVCQLANFGSDDAIGVLVLDCA
jgi:hypothetical protein